MSTPKSAPNSIASERVVLGVLMVHPDKWDDLQERVAADDFYRADHQLIFGAIADLARQRKPLDFALVADHLRLAGTLEDAGGMAYVGGLCEDGYSALGALGHADAVRTHATLRALIAAGVDIAEMGYRTQGRELQALLSDAERMVLGVRERGMQAADFPPDVSEVMGSWIDHLEKVQDGTIVPGLPTGLTDLDQKTAGLHAGELVIIGARPSLGKTAMALNFCDGAAATGKRALMFSMEMPRRDLITRVVARRGRVPLDAMRRPRGMDAAMFGRAVHVTGGLKHLLIDDRSSLTAEHICAMARRVHRRQPLAIVVVDYLQLLVGQGEENRTRELESASHALKRLARELMVPVVALAQLNRNVSNRRPVISDLKDCLTGDTLITNARTGVRVPIKTLAESKEPFEVWSTDCDMKLVRSTVTDAWCVGPREVFTVRTRLGREVKCTNRHQFLTVDGWCDLRQLVPGVAIAAPRRLDQPVTAEAVAPSAALLVGWLIGDGNMIGTPKLTVVDQIEAEFAKAVAEQAFGLRPRIQRERASATAKCVIMTTGGMSGAGTNALTSWLRRLGIWGLVGKSKRLPTSATGWSDEAVASLLRGLFHADGSFTRKANGSAAIVRLSTISEELARGVQHLLLRFEITARVSSEMRPKGGYATEERHLWNVTITAREAVVRFMDRVGFLLEKHERAVRRLVRIKGNDAGHVDRLPLEVTAHADAVRRQRGLSHRQLGWRAQGKRLSRATAALIGSRLLDPKLIRLATSDVLWDEIASIEPAGREMVYDLTVDMTHNFCANDIVVHNCGAIEQDADLVLLLWRDENPESKRKGIVDIIIGKQRNGPIGIVHVAWLPQFCSFENLAPEDIPTDDEPAPQKRGFDYEATPPRSFHEPVQPGLD